MRKFPCFFAHVPVATECTKHCQEWGICIGGSVWRAFTSDCAILIIPDIQLLRTGRQYPMDTKDDVGPLSGLKSCGYMTWYSFLRGLLIMRIPLPELVSYGPTEEREREGEREG